MGNNLPPGVTASDIDKHFGGEDPEPYSVVIEYEAWGRDEESAIEQVHSGEAEEQEVVYVERK
jgi:hypothetical protein